MPDFDLRALTLGGAFKPKVQDIPTPDLLKVQGAPDELLRLVSLSAEARIALAGSMQSDGALNSARLVCACLRYRDTGGDDGNGTPVYAMTDAPTIVAQDFDLLQALALVVNPFLGIGQPIGQAVEAEKNGSSTTPSSDGGPGSPTTSDSATSENANQP